MVEKCPGVNNLETVTGGALRITSLLRKLFGRQMPESARLLVFEPLRSQRTFHAFWCHQAVLRERHPNVYKERPAHAKPKIARKPLKG